MDEQTIQAHVAALADPVTAETATDALTQIGPAAIEPLLAGLAASESTGHTRAIVGVLGRLGGEGPVDPTRVLSGLLYHSDDGVCQAAAQALAGLGRRGQAAEAALIEMLLNPHWSPFRTAETVRVIAQATASLWPENATRVLIAHLLCEASDSRRAAADHLANLGLAAREAIPLMVWLLREEQNRGVRVATVRALGHLIELDPDRIARALSERLEDRHTEVRTAAVEVLILPEVGHRAVPHLEEELTIADEATRRLAAECLRDIATPAAIQVLAKVLPGHWDPDVRRIALEALRGHLLLAPAAIATIAQVALKDESDGVRARAGDMLLELGIAATGPLLGALGDDARTAQSRACELLTRLGRVAPLPTDAVKALRGLVDADADVPVVARAAEAVWRNVGANGDDRQWAIEVLAGRLAAKGRNTAGREYAAVLLGTFGTDAAAAADTLTTVAGDAEEDPSVRGAACVALRQVAPDRDPAKPQA